MKHGDRRYIPYLDQLAPKMWFGLFPWKKCFSETHVIHSYETNWKARIGRFEILPCYYN